MSTIIQIKRGTKTALDGVTLTAGEIAYTTDTYEVYVGDGTDKHLVGGVIVDTTENRPSAGVSGRIFLDQDTGYTYIDDGTEWVSISSAIDESEIDHDLLHNYVADKHIDHSGVSITGAGLLVGQGGDITTSRTFTLNHDDVDHDQTTNYVANEHIDHTNVSITGDGPISGGGNISANRTIGLNYKTSQLGVDVNDDLYVIESGLDHDSLNNVHQDVNTNASPTFNSVTLSTVPDVGNDAATKDYVDGLIQGLEWQSSVIDFYDPSASLPDTPTVGDRYISSATANGWTEDYIYEWDGTEWIEINVSSGMAIWVEAADRKYVYNGTGWVVFGETITHNNLSSIQGGTATERYHLSQSAYNNLSDADQSIKTTDSVVFDDATISNPVNIYNLSHDSFADYVADKHIDHSGVSITGAGLLEGQGGDITASRTFTLNHGDVDHDQTTNYVANEHVDWSATNSLNIHSDNITSTSVTQHEGDINHDELDNYVANKHVDHSNVNITAGEGLSGGGNITTSRTIDINRDTTTGATVAPVNITEHGAGILLDNYSITHTNGEIEVSVVDGGTF